LGGEVPHLPDQPQGETGEGVTTNITALTGPEKKTEGKSPVRGTWGIKKKGEIGERINPKLQKKLRLNVKKGEQPTPGKGLFSRRLRLRQLMTTKRLR